MRSDTVTIAASIGVIGLSLGFLLGVIISKTIKPEIFETEISEEWFINASNELYKQALSISFEKDEKKKQELILILDNNCKVYNRNSGQIRGPWKYNVKETFDLYYLLDDKRFEDLR